MMIELIKDTIDNQDIDNLITWLKTYPHLTKGKTTLLFESKWSEYINTKYSVFVNSGSSANLAMMYAAKISGKLRNNKVVIPSLSWSTDLAPALQLGFQPYLCDTCKDTLGIDINHFESLCKNNDISALLLVHVLGIPAKLNEIINICEKYNVMILEDTCESTGSTYNNIKLGNFGSMSSFSFYFGHHMSTIEGGMVCTNNKELYDILLMIRSHGWDRDLDNKKQKELRSKYNINEFNSQFTFYVPGFNIRSTDLQAYIGIYQIDKLEQNNIKRYENYKFYQKNIKNDFWKPKETSNFISSFAYPIIHPKRDSLIKSLNLNKIGTRPLICGNIENQPVYKNMVTTKKDDNICFSKIIDKYGLYIPTQPLITNDERNLIVETINKELN